MARHPAAKMIHARAILRGAEADARYVVETIARTSLMQLESFQYDEERGVANVGFRAAVTPIHILRAVASTHRVEVVDVE